MEMYLGRRSSLKTNTMEPNAQATMFTILLPKNCLSNEEMLRYKHIRYKLPDLQKNKHLAGTGRQNMAYRMPDLRKSQTSHAGWRSLAVTGGHWRSLAVTGGHCRSLAVTGCHSGTNSWVQAASPANIKHLKPAGRHWTNISGWLVVTSEHSSTNYLMASFFSAAKWLSQDAFAEGAQLCQG